MKIPKTDGIHFRVSPILKKKFNVAIGFLDTTSVFNNFMQEIVREYEKQYGVIKVGANKQDQYDMITNMFGMEIEKERMDELKRCYPKTKKNIVIYGD